MNKYPALMFLVSATSIIAWGVAGIFGIAGLVALTQRSSGVLAAIALWVIGALLWVYVKAGAELIQVFVQIEENTRSRG